MVKKLFALAFVGITTTASVAGVALTNSSFSQLNAREDHLTMEFTANEVARFDTSGDSRSFTVSTTNAMAGIEYSVTGTISTRDYFAFNIKNNNHIFYIDGGEEVELSMRFEFHYNAIPVSVVFYGTNNGFSYTQTFNQIRIIKNGNLIETSLPDLDYDKDNTTEISIDRIVINYSC